MESRQEELRRKYKEFKKGEEDPLKVKDEARLVLEEARKIGNQKVMDEVEDILLDVEFSIKEDKCKCHKKQSIC